MKTLIITATLILTSLCSWAQKLGYEDVQIGSNIDSIYYLNKYQIVKGDKETEFFIKGADLKICAMDVAYLKGEIDSNRTIINLSVFTKEKLYANYRQYDDDFFRTLFSIKNTVGAASWDNLNKPDGTRTFGWRFRDTNTVLFMSVKEISSFATDFKVNYSFFWEKYKENKMW
ncbi:hypothetical protein [Mucilaginibacter sp. BT774]|uniref:hypothetical protein n=1 Tax=Mucilaginibacter sp. BT774 TaxID=3062276 RepID=UPI002675800E|nr:hypothetical protein [Mucilaginibacter sp. BT774]MDO3627273.1 hypothetical protein [Mucilaginibacter sp. BT774]